MGRNVGIRLIFSYEINPKLCLHKESWRTNELLKALPKKEGQYLNPNEKGASVLQVKIRSAWRTQGKRINEYEVKTHFTAARAEGGKLYIMEKWKQLKV